MSIPRFEYPRPQFEREDWINLNGQWEFEFDFGKSGRDKNLQTTDSFSGKIVVPFCPESKLSGVGYVDFIPAVWYRRTFVLPEKWIEKRVLLHFGAVDYDSEVWINGVSMGRHLGGYSSFSYEITKALKPGKNVIVVCAEDDVRSNLQPRGKQSVVFQSQGYDYTRTRTTGIWQTVWLEAVSSSYISNLRITPDLENSRVNLVAAINGEPDGMELFANAMLDGSEVGSESIKVGGGIAQITIKIDQDKVKPWEPNSPVLYDLKLKLMQSGKTLDEVKSYFGLRSLGWRGSALLINGKPVFQRLILDQGLFPTGIYTAPSDDELRHDIERSLAMGFNGARLHQKVFEERYLYWADKLGYIVWGEMPDWKIDHFNGEARDRFTNEWIEVIGRDYNHPAIVGWCPFNETAPLSNDNFIKNIYRITKQFDPTRPAIDTSGHIHTNTTDVYDSHDYDQDPVTFAVRHSKILEGKPFVNFPDRDAPYSNQPYFVSEFGGIWWDPEHLDNKKNWVYGERPKNEHDFIERFRKLVDVLLNNPRMCGFCYTQLTDVEQEVNGLYTYDRKPKFDSSVIRKIISQPAAIEVCEE